MPKEKEKKEGGGKGGRTRDREIIVQSFPHIERILYITWRESPKWHVGDITGSDLGVLNSRLEQTAEGEGSRGGRGRGRVGSLGVSSGDVREGVVNVLCS